MDKVNKLGKIGQVLVIFLILTLIILIIYYCYSGQIYQLLPLQRGLEIIISFQNLTPIAKVIITGFVFCKHLVSIFTLLTLFKLFGQFSLGRVFEFRTMKLIKYTGMLIILIDLSDIIISALCGPLLTLLGITEPIFYINLKIAYVHFGLFIYIIGHIYSIAISEHKENILTI